MHIRSSGVYRPSVVDSINSGLVGNVFYIMLTLLFDCEC